MPPIPFNIQQLFDEKSIKILSETSTPFTADQLNEIYSYFKDHPSMVKLPKQTKIEKFKEQIREHGWDEISSTRLTPGISSEEASGDSLDQDQQASDNSDEFTTPISAPTEITTRGFKIPLLVNSYAASEASSLPQTPETPQPKTGKAPPLLLDLIPDEDDVQSAYSDEHSLRTDLEDITIPEIPYSVLKLQDENGADKFIIVYPVKLGEGKFGTAKVAQELILQTNEDGTKLVAGKLIVIKKSLRLNTESEELEKIYNNEVANTKLIGDRYIGDGIRQTGEQFKQKNMGVLSYDGKMYLASDLIPGSNMEDFIRSPKITETQKLMALLNLFEYLQTFYNKFVYHKDLHLGNVLVYLNPNSSQITAQPIDLAEALAKTSLLQNYEQPTVDLEKLGKNILHCCAKNKLKLPQLIGIAEKMASEDNPPSLAESRALVEQALKSPPQTTITQTTTISDFLKSPNFTEIQKLKVLLELLKKLKLEIYDKGSIINRALNLNNISIEYNFDDPNNETTNISINPGLSTSKPTDDDAIITNQSEIMKKFGENILVLSRTATTKDRARLELVANQMSSDRPVYIREIMGLLQKQIGLLAPLPKKTASSKPLSARGPRPPSAPKTLAKGFKIPRK